MGDRAAANLSAGISFIGGGEKVGYFTAVSDLKAANSVGDDFNSAARDERIREGRSLPRYLMSLLESLIGGRANISLESFFTLWRSRIPPKHVNSVFQ